MINDANDRHLTTFGSDDRRVLVYFQCMYFRQCNVLNLQSLVARCINLEGYPQQVIPYKDHEKN